MRKWFILIWLLLPVGLLYFHYGPGQRLLAYDRAASAVRRAEALETIAQKNGSPENWLRVVEAYQQAKKLLGDEESLIARRIQLNTAHAMMYQGQLYEAIQELDVLLSEAVEKKMPERYTEQVRETLARAQFGAAWVMRLEGAETRSWTAQAEKARQNFRLLAETALEQSDKAGRARKSQNEVVRKAELPTAIDHQKNLESTVRLEQLDASTIKGIPLPKEAKNGQGKGLGDKMKKGEGEGETEGEGEGEGNGKQKEGDARQKGAGSGQRGSGLGS
jgi:hypothetical protein